KCVPLARLISRTADGSGGAEGSLPVLPTAWLGEAISIKDPTSLNFGRHSGSNSLIVGHQEEAALSTLVATGLGLAAWCAARACGGVAQPAPGASPLAQFYLLDGTPVDSSHAGMVSGVFTRMTSAKVGGVRQAPGLIGEIYEEFQRRDSVEE